MQQQNHYRLLDVPFSASRKDITAAYRNKMREWHPDKFRGDDIPQAEEHAKMLNFAYSILSDPRKREDYDRSIRVQAVQSQIMEKYVAGYGGWNMGGSGPLPADAPKRSMTAREHRERRISDRNAFRSMFISFVFLLMFGLLLLAIFSIVNTIF